MTYEEILQKAISKGFRYVCRDSDGFFCAFISEPIADGEYKYWRIREFDTKKFMNLGFVSDNFPEGDWNDFKIDLRKV
jgi:hypothetical protein